MAVCYRYPNAEKCANCGWNMKTAKCLSAFDFRARELSTAEREILASWLPTDSGLDNRPVCRECVNILCGLVLEPRPVARRLGHQCVCAACGDSMARRPQSQPVGVDLTRPEHLYIFTECLKSQQLQDTGREFKMCRPCVQKAHRALWKKQHKDNPIAVINVKSDAHPAMQPENSEPKDQVTATKTMRSGATIASTSETKTLAKEKKGKEILDEEGNIKKLVNELELKGKYNARGKVGSCTKCNRPANQLMSLKMRQLVMTHQNIYISPSATFCEAHKMATASRLPVNKDNWTCKFTGEEISDMLFLLQRREPIDFGEIEKIHPFVIKDYLGVDLEEFERILEGNSVLRERADGKFALAVWLANKNKKHGDAVLASLSQRPTSDVTNARLLAHDAMAKKP